jgi:hypothetical protein
MSDIIDAPEEEKKPSEYAEKRFTPIIIITPVLIIGLAMKHFHLPYHDWLMLIGLGGFAGHAVAIGLNLQRNEAIVNIGVLALSCGVTYHVYKHYSQSGGFIALGAGILSVVLCWMYFKKLG